MVVLIVLLAAWLIFRAMGAAGVQALAAWQHSAVYALAVMLVFTATAHFNKVRCMLSDSAFSASDRIRPPTRNAIRCRPTMSSGSLRGIETQTIVT